MKSHKIIFPVSMRNIQIHDTFWGHFMELARTKMIPYQWKALNDEIPDAEPSHCIKNFRIAAGIENGEFGGFVFQDSDLSKWIEAAAYSLIWYPDPALEKTIDDAISLIVSAQQEDGYLDTYYIINGLEKRFTQIADNHELYCAGHMIEAAVAYYHATGKRLLLDAMIRFVAYIDSKIGPEAGKLHAYPGHEIIEMALIRLYDITLDEKHLKLAEYFINERGKNPLYFEEEFKLNNASWYWKDSIFQYQYYQAGKPVRDQHTAEGHAVRAVYLYSGIADIARKTKDESLSLICNELWNNITQKQMYITGAIGSSAFGESFSYDYNLPNDLVYGETCASIGLVFFAHRMMQLSLSSQYADIIEKELYNGIISGVSLDGTEFFYVNPLEVVPDACAKDQLKVHVKPERQKWFGCACCPPNLARLTTSLPSYLYMQTEDTLYVNLYMGNEMSTVIGEKSISISMSTDYPWDETITIKVNTEKDFSGKIALRIPGWCHSYTLKRDQFLTDHNIISDGYLILDKLKSEELITLQLAMPAVLMSASSHVRDDYGKVALMRGPIVYCLEEADNGNSLHLLSISSDCIFVCEKEESLLGGVVSIHTVGKRYFSSDPGSEPASLYTPYKKSSFEEVSVKWIPYYSWANRGLGEMSVWISIES